VQRGQQLADRPCRCGGELTAKTAGRPSQAKGLSYTVCAICEKRTLKPLIPAAPVRVWRRAGSDRLIAVGSPICRWHEARVSKPEAVELGLLHLEELPSSERTWGVPIPEYLAKRAEHEAASMFVDQRRIAEPAEPAPCGLSQSRHLGAPFAKPSPLRKLARDGMASAIERTNA
jgi:hypothetical protein